MTIKRVVIVILISFIAFICAVPVVIIGGAFVIPIIRDWQNQRLITVIESGQYLFDNIRQFSGSYKEKNFYYWSSKPIADVKQSYEVYTTAPFEEVNSYGENWFIAALKESHLIAYSFRNRKQFPADFCDYTSEATCVGVMLLDAGQPFVPKVLEGMYNLSANERSKIPVSGTLIVFSYFIPDFS